MLSASLEKELSNGRDTLEGAGDTLKMNTQMNKYSKDQSNSQQLGKAELQCGICIKQFTAGTSDIGTTSCLFFLISYTPISNITCIIIVGIHISPRRKTEMCFSALGIFYNMKV